MPVRIARAYHLSGAVGPSLDVPTMLVDLRRCVAPHGAAERQQWQVNRAGMMGGAGAVSVQVSDVSGLLHVAEQDNRPLFDLAVAVPLLELGELARAPMASSLGTCMPCERRRE